MATRYTNPGVAGTQQRGLATLSGLAVLRTGAPVRPTSQGPRPNVVVGALVVSPAAVRDKMNQVNAQIASLDSEIRINAKRPEFLTTWTQFKDNWQKFYDDHQSYLKIFLTGTGTLERKANEYQAQLTNWYEALKTEVPNARLAFPPPLPPTAPPTGASVPWWGVSLITILGTGAVVYGTYASYLYIREAQRKKQFLEEEVVPRVLASRGIPAFRGMNNRRSEEDPAFDGAGDDGSDSLTRIHALPARDPDDDGLPHLGGRLYPDNFGKSGQSYRMTGLASRNAGSRQSSRLTQKYAGRTSKSAVKLDE